jgi:hypothetical protein
MRGFGVPSLPLGLKARPWALSLSCLRLPLWCLVQQPPPTTPTTPTSAGASAPQQPPAPRGPLLNSLGPGVLAGPLPAPKFAVCK